MPPCNSLFGELENSIRSGSNASRIQTLRRITDLFLAGSESYSEDQIDLFDEVFGRLVRNVEAEALAELSGRLADVTNAPIGTIRRLAYDDDIAVAAPVLSSAAGLTDRDLAAVARTKSQGHMLAISTRDSISPLVTDLLVARGNDHVVERLSGNPGAAFSDSGYARLIDKSEQNETLLEIVASRSDISPGCFQRLLRRATADVCTRLLQNAKPEFRGEIEAAILKISSRVDHHLSHEKRKAQNKMQALHEFGRLNESVILTHLRSGELAHAVAGLALLAACGFELIEEIFDSNKAHALQLACKAADFEWPATLALLKARSGPHGLSENQLGQFRSDYYRLSQTTARRVIRFWHVRKTQQRDTQDTLA